MTTGVEAFTAVESQTFALSGNPYLEPIERVKAAAQAPGPVPGGGRPGIPTHLVDRIVGQVWDRA